ncbi:YchJ family protein [Williamsia muralis]|uniref:YchJ family protein n=1 Tax=Williamsia marianensis TaxID=85044 RepID=UPI0037F15184
MTRPPSGPRRCPCTSGLIWDDCCGPVVSRVRKAPTAEALMRSRFSAFAVGDADYLLYSWHPRTRPDVLDLDATMRWYRLDIESTLHGSLFDSVGEVEFTAFYRIKGSGAGTLHERSRFERHEGRWVYVDGVVVSD